MKIWYDLYIMVNTITKKEKGVVSISKMEYLRLKKLDKRFSDFLSYLDHLMDIRGAREEVRQNKVIPQEKLFKKLGF